MHSTFVLSQSTALYSSAWTPSSTGSYAGTCIFLILLAAIFRGLLAYRHSLEVGWRQKRSIRRPIVVAQEPSGDAEGKGAETNAVPLPPRPASREAPDQWRVSVDIPRAAVVVVTVTVGYLL
jgi:hypothetical protein